MGPDVRGRRGTSQQGKFHRGYHIIVVWVNRLDGASDRRRVRTLVRSIVLPRPFKGIYLFYVASLGPSDIQFIPFDCITERVFEGEGGASRLVYAISTSSFFLLPTSHF